ncbi:MAG: 16S rRNA processing protein RimM [Alloprevotella sp.]|nr:16S rRNA processing protein RimM [Alloprevotella sp.]
MVRREDTISIGRITKSRGLQGEVEILVADDVFADTDCPYLFLDRDGLLVPFFWEEYRFKSERVAVVKFEGCNDEAAARRLVGSDVRFPTSELPETSDDAFPNRLARLADFIVANAHGEEVGRITAVDDTTQNVVLNVRTNTGNNILLPFHPDLIANFDATARRISMHIPDGLLDING